MSFRRCLAFRDRPGWIDQRLHHDEMVLAAPTTTRAALSTMRCEKAEFSET